MTTSVRTWRRAWSPLDTERAERMKGAGASYSGIARALGVTRTAVRYRLDPTYRAKVIQRTAERRAQSKAQS